jgi:hypothetical protein
MGSGYKAFTAGEVLTASDVNNYLMEQSVMTFGGSAARSSAIGTANFEEGMVSYLTDTDKVEAYNGTNWVSVAPTSTQGLTLINTTSFSGVSSQSINDVFSATYTNYQVLIEFRPSANAAIDLRFRVAGADNSTSNYSNALYNYTSSGGGGGQTADNAVSYARVDAGFTGTDGVTFLTIFNPFATQKTSIITRTEGFGSSNPILTTSFGGNVFNATTSFTGFSLIRSSGTFTGSVSVYGFNI